MIYKTTVSDISFASYSLNLIVDVFPLFIGEKIPIDIA